MQLHLDRPDHEFLLRGADGTAGTGGPSEERVEAVGVGDATPAPAPRLSRRDGLWLALVAITFAATNAAVLFITP